MTNFFHFQISLKMTHSFKLTKMTNIPISLKMSIFFQIDQNDQKVKFHQNYQFFQTDQKSQISPKWPIFPFFQLHQNDQFFHFSNFTKNDQFFSANVLVRLLNPDSRIRRGRNEWAFDKKSCCVHHHCVISKKSMSIALCPIIVFISFGQRAGSNCFTRLFLRLSSIDIS